MQATWLTEIRTFSKFEKEARLAPERVYLRGARPCFPNALTFAAVAEELSCFWVEGASGWKARVVRKNREWLSAEYRDQSGTQNDRRKRRTVQKLVIVQER
jgi:hypothetical protein